MIQDEITQEKFNKAVIALKKNNRLNHPDENGMIKITHEEGLALYKFLAPKYDI